MSNDPSLTICGNLTGDPHLSFTTAGDPWVRFTIAHTPRRFDKTTNSWVDGEALFLRCTAWRDLAEHVAESVMRGTRVVATGRLRQSTWTDQTTGEKRSAVELAVDEIGPSLRFATARIQKTHRTNSSTTTATGGSPPGGNEPWDSSNSALAGFATPIEQTTATPTQPQEPPF